MEIIVHRINNIKQLKKIPTNFGTEIDIRSHKSKLILNHEPYKSGNSLDSFLNNYKHGTLILNIKEAGIEEDVINKVKKKKIKSFFLLDVEFPYIFKSIKQKQTNIAIRFSEKESIDNAKYLVDKFKWVWIDTLTKLPLNQKNIKVLKKFKTCLVCPERWGRPKDIEIYKKKMKRLNFKPDAVMTSLKHVKHWLN